MEGHPAAKLKIQQGIFGGIFMLYDRKIKYLDYYENGERVRGGGFAKLEVRDRTMRLELKVTGLHPTDSFDREVMLQGNDKEKVLGSMALVGGKGQYLHLCHDIEDIGGTGISYEELEGIRIPLGAGRVISCVLQTQNRTAERKHQEQEKERSRRESKRDSTEKSTNDFEQTIPFRTRKEERSGTGKEVRFQVWGREGQESVAEEERRGNIPDRETEVPDNGEERKGKQGVEIREQGVGRNPDKGQEEYQEKEEARKRESREGAEVWKDKQQRTQKGGWREERQTEQEGAEGQRREQAYRWMDERRNEQEKRIDKQWRTQEEGGNERRNRQRESELTGASRQAGSQETEKTLLQKEDKWAQLWSVYPHIHPFQDEREYLSIRPSDFVLFPAASYKMVNNSFLLHGYYNYHHLLLGKVEKRGEDFYYIGVPGNFYEREKQVAIMFGFESFECAEEPAQAGDFGYYMMRTEL